MIHSGLVSITFRKLSPREILDLVLKSRVEGIEWGGDVHVPHGDLNRAREVGKMTRDAGIKTPSYGSYYCVGEEKEDGLPFEKVVETALVLETPIVRVWAGRKGSAEASEDYRNRVVAESCRIAEIASEASLVVSYEYHGHSLTDTPESAKRFLEDVDRENVKTYWQVPVGASFQEALSGLNLILQWLTNVHIFHWDLTPDQRRPIEVGTENWKRYLATVGSTGREHFAMIEYVKDDAPESFLSDAKTLVRWIGEI